MLSAYGHDKKPIHHTPKQRLDHFSLPTTDDFSVQSFHTPRIWRGSDSRPSGDVEACGQAIRNPRSFSSMLVLGVSLFLRSWFCKTSSHPALVHQQLGRVTSRTSHGLQDPVLSEASGCLGAWFRVSGDTIPPSYGQNRECYGHIKKTVINALKIYIAKSLKKERVGKQRPTPDLGDQGLLRRDPNWKTGPRREHRPMAIAR